MIYTDTIQRAMLRKLATSLALLTSILCLSVTTSSAQQSFQVYPNSLTINAPFGDSRESGVYIESYVEEDLKLMISITGPDVAAFSVPDSIVIEHIDDDTTNRGGFHINFTPTKTGAHSATVDVSDGTTTRQIKLVGVGTIPGPDLYGQYQWSATVGSTDCDVIYLRNNTSNQLTITKISLEAGAPFSISNIPALPYPLEPDAILELTVCFEPTVSGMFYDSVLVEFQGGGMTGSVTHSVYAQASPPPGPCVTIDGDSTFGTVDADVTIDEQFTVSNNSGVTLTLNAEIQGDPHFTILSPSLPYTLQTGASVTFTVRLFSGNDNMKQYFGAKMVITSTDPAKRECQSNWTLWARGLYSGQPVDSTYYPLTGGKKEKLDIDSEAGDNYRIFKFYNPTNDSLTVVSVEMKKGDDFTARVLFNPPQTSLPIKLMQGGTMLVRIDLINEEPGDYKDDLIINVENSITAIEFSVEGTVGTASVTSQAKNSVAKLTIGENPAMGPVTIGVANAQKAQIAIMDLAGRTVFETSETTLRWDASQVQGGSASQVYFVRATGVDDLGQPFTVTDRLVIVK